MSAEFDAEKFFTSGPGPGSARVLGWRFVEADAAEGRIVIEFEAREDFVNPAGFVQGGFLAAMLDDAMGPAVVVKSKGKLYGTTVDLHVHYLRPVRPGTVRVEAVATQLGQSIAFAEGKLFDARGRLAARAVCSSKLLTGVFDKTETLSETGQEARSQ